MAEAPKTGYARLAGKRPYLIGASEAIFLTQRLTFFCVTLRWHRDASQIVLPLAAPSRLSGGEISKLINGFVRPLEASEFEERLARLEEKAHEAD
jgi:hypothetical protein